MESNLNLYTIVLITFSHFTVGGTKLTYVPNTTIYPKTTPQMYTLAQAHTEYMFSPCAFTASWHSLNLLLLKEAVTQCICSEELSELDGKPNGWGTPRPISLELAGKCSFISRGSGHKTLTSLGKYPQFSCGPQSDFVPLILVTDLE